MIAKMIKQAVRAALGKERAKNLKELSITIDVNKKTALLQSEGFDGEMNYKMASYKEPVRSLVNAKVKEQLPKGSELKYIKITYFNTGNTYTGTALYNLDGKGFSKHLAL